MKGQALPEINLALCTRCGVCVDLCPANAVDMAKAGPTIARPDDCTFCTWCEEICAHGAITCSYEIVWGTP